MKQGTGLIQHTQGTGARCKQAVAYALMCCLLGALSACDVQTTVVVPENHYDISLSKHTIATANKHKTDFIEKKLEDEEVDESLSEAAQKARLGVRYEQAINALYVGNVRHEADFHKVLDLVEYATKLFQENEFSNQLEARSPALANFMIDYQINAALTSPDNQMRDDQIHEQGQILAEQQSAYMTLKSRYDSLQQTEAELREQLAAAEAKLAEASSSEPEVDEQTNTAVLF